MRTKRIRKAVLIILIIAIGLFAVGQIAARIADGRSRKTGKTPEGYDDPAYKSDEEIKKELSGKKSDVKGMSMYDKYKAGLIPMENSDTDGDGLTDAMEIDVYGTDPLKASTAGDMYTDLEKVQKGLDVNKKLSYDGKPAYPGNKSSGILTFSGKTADDRLVTADDITGMDSLRGHKVYKEYLISKCGNNAEVSIDLKKAVKGQDGADKTNTAVYVKETEKRSAKPVKFTLKGSKAVLDYDFKADKTYSLFITNKTLSPFPSRTGFSCDAASDGNASGLDGIVYGSPLLHIFSGELNIRYLEKDNKDDEDTEKKTLIAQEVKTGTADDDLKLENADTDRIKPASQAQITMMYNLFEKLLPMCNGKRDDGSPAKLFFYFDRYTNADRELTAKEKKEIDSRYVTTGFTADKDALPFKNFGTKVSPGGVCGGISYYTMYLFDNGKVPALTGSGKWADDTPDTPWDISGDSFKDLRTKGKVHGYKDYDYVAEHKAEDGTFSKDLSADDESFANMMTIWWGKWGGAANGHRWSYSKAVTDEKTKESRYIFATAPYDYDSIITYAKKQIDKGKIVTFGATLGTEYSSTEDYREGRKSHAINLIAYKDYGDGRVDFQVYDSNFPDRDDLWMYTKYRQTTTVTQTDSFWFKYQPDESNNDYVMTNIKSGYYHIYMADDNLKHIGRLAYDEDAVAYMVDMTKKGVMAYKMPDKYLEKMKKENAKY